ncbi:MAG: BatA and WFA domain-containing protein [Planctomycetia bacterium]|nr:BatA and WFA domain-containing protein [Planctomycetia bacterium]
MITFIHPYAFVWLGLALPLILFYLWRRRPVRLEMTTGTLWRRVIPLLHPRRAWQRQRWLVSLVTQLVILVLLVTALAEPCWRRPQRVAVVLDCTASMGVTQEDGKTRLQMALAKAEELVERMGYNDSLAVLSVGDGIQILCRMSNDREKIRQSLAKVPSAGGNASVSDAAAIARSLILSTVRGEWDEKTDHVVLISDGCFPHSEKVLADETIHWLPTGDSVGNVEIEHLASARRNKVDLLEGEVLVALRNHFDVPARGTLTVRANGEAWISQEVTIPAAKEGGRWSDCFTLRRGEKTMIQALFQAEESQADALVEDNRAEVVLPEAFGYDVTLVTAESGDGLLRQALRKVPGVEVTILNVEGEEVPAIPFTQRRTEEGIQRFAVAIYDRVLPNSWEGMGHGIFLGPEKETLWWEREETRRDYVLMPWLEGLRSGISTAGVGFVETAMVRPKKWENARIVPWLFSQSALETVEKGKTLPEDENYAKTARTVEMTALGWGLDYSDCEENGLPRIVLLACDLRKSDWMLADDFPFFLQYAMDWMIDSEASRERLHRGVEPQWESQEELRDGNLNVPPKPEVVFALPGEDIVPMWSILILLLFPAGLVEWAFYQRRWLE